MEVAEGLFGRTTMVESDSSNIYVYIYIYVYIHKHTHQLHTIRLFNIMATIRVHFFLFDFCT